MSVDNPKISVIIPCYNAGKTISASLRSLVNQVYKDFEVIIVNDGSTDNSADVISSFSRTHNLNVVYVEQPNSGVSTARNTALKKARGEYITFLDADDLYDPYFLQDGIAKLEKNGVDISICQYKFVTELNEAEGTISDNYSRLDTHGLIELYYHHRIQKVNFGGGVFKNFIIRKFELTFPTDIKYGEDSLFLCQYLIHCENGGIYIQYPHYRYYMNPSSATNKVTYQVVQNIEASRRIDTLLRTDGMGLFTARAIWAATKGFSDNDEFFKRLTEEYDVKQAMRIMSKKGDERSIRISSLLYQINPKLFRFAIKQYQANKGQ